ncbi:lysophospholipid acyltransferase family protein [Haliea sp. E17]|uniref:lysophospholipid acyltransferase family protein n=1 Tax=Haliea sp. E17 TaxID=3401576 RepID=UPI003AAB5039
MPKNARKPSGIHHDEFLQTHIEEILQVSKPEGLHIDLFCKAVKKVFDPHIVGAEKIPDGPCMFVANHSLFALDGYILGPLMYRELNRFARPMLDRFLLEIPHLGDAFVGFGSALGHPEVCSALMREGHDILLFPGGAHEAVKPASALYQLQWRERYGFVRLAAQHGYTIMPFGIVGPDEMYGHLIEGEDLPGSPLGLLLKRLGILSENTRADLLPPIPVGALGTLLPKPHRCYIGFGNPVDLSHHGGRKPTQRTQEKIRAEVAAEIEEVLADLLVTRARNRSKEGLLRRVLTI